MKDGIKKDDLSPLSIEIGGLVVDVFYKDESNNLYGFPTELANFVGYKHPRDKASTVFDDNKDILDKFSGVGKIPTPSGIQEARILINEGIHFFIMELKKPLAKTLKLAYAHIVEKYRRGELVPVTLSNIIELPDDLDAALKRMHYYTNILIEKKIEKTKIVALTADRKADANYERWLNATIDDQNQAEIEELLKKYIDKKVKEDNNSAPQYKSYLARCFYRALNSYLTSRYGIKPKGKKKPKHLIINRYFPDVMQWIRENLLKEPPMKKLVDFSDLFFDVDAKIKVNDT